jgi:GvpD gas vesicle protein
MTPWTPVLFGRKKVVADVPPPVRRDSTPETPGYFSSGIADLDALLGGGYGPGRVVAVVGDDTVRGEDFFLLGLPPVLNFLALRRGAIVVPPAGVPADQVRTRAIQYISSSTFDARARVIDYTAVQASGTWMVPMGRYGRDDAMRAMVAAERAVAGNPRSPFVELMALDTMEGIVGAETAVRMFFNGIQRTKAVGNLGLVWVRSTSAGRDAITGMADDYFALSREGERVVLRGIRPAFEARAIVWAERHGVLTISLGLPAK